MDFSVWHYFRRVVLDWVFFQQTCEVPWLQYANVSERFVLHKRATFKGDPKYQTRRIIPAVY